MDRPLLFSFRRCPYAMRARLALHASGVAIDMREVDLKHKPAEMLALSPKGTVPVLQLPDGGVIDESLDVMRWALARHDPEDWLGGDATESAALIARNDGPFKQALDRYKYPNRAGGAAVPASVHRDQAAPVLADLDARLAANTYLLDNKMRLVDAALAPFVRQFAMVDPAWFAATPWAALRRWLDGIISSPRFVAIMQKR